MSYIKAGTDASGNDIKLFYQDLGTGNATQTVVLIHGWPLSHEMWDYQLAELPAHGLRVVAYDRRGFGKSSQPWGGYDYDTLADDLKAVLDELNLQNVTLVGFSMGGGEVARYMSRHGGARVSKVAFISAVTPYLLKTDDNPDGVDQDVFDEITTNLQKDRADFLKTFGKQFYGVNLISQPVSQAHLDGDFARAYVASHKATLECAKSFAQTDFRDDLAQIQVPTLIIHGDADKTVPIEASGERTANALPNASYIVYDGRSPRPVHHRKRSANTGSACVYPGRCNCPGINRNHDIVLSTLSITKRPAIFLMAGRFVIAGGRSSHRPMAFGR